MAVETLFQQMEIRGFVDGWARRTLLVWKKELRKRKIGITGELERSFKYQLDRDRNELLGVTFKFLYYGRLRDMNVGRGLKAFERRENREAQRDARRYGMEGRVINRRKKNWYNKPKMAQFYRLQELLADRMQQTVSSSVSNILTSNHNISING